MKQEELKPPLLDSNINEIEFLIKGAKDDYLTNQWICDFISRPLFGLQLWRTNQIGLEIKGCKAPGLIEGLEAFVKEVESAIPIYRFMIKRLAERMETEV